jgi:hypothetical protein
MSVLCKALFTTCAALAVFLLLWLMASLLIGEGPFFIDPQDALANPDLRVPKNREGRTFESSLNRYLDLAKSIIGLAVGSIALLLGYVGYVWQKQSSGLTNVQSAVTIPTVLLACCVLALVTFMAIVTWRYETYLQDVNAHSRFWYSLDLALGFSGLLFFGAGYIAASYSLLLLRAS